MCYAIPGRICAIDGRVAVVDYFGEKRRAYTDLLEEAAVGDHVYAQGGFLIRKISEDEAQDVLKLWEDIFFKLKEQDKKLALSPKNLYERANAVRQNRQDNSCCVHGIIEFSNYCGSNCLYCGIRRDNRMVERYRMKVPEILDAVDQAVSYGFQAIVLQSGEDPYYTDDKLVEMVREIRARQKVLIFLSVGERSRDVYKRMYDEGARGALIRFETSNEEIYARVKNFSPSPSPSPLPPLTRRRAGEGEGRGEGVNALASRLRLIRDIREMGYLLVTGFLIGLPGQTSRDIVQDIKMTADLGAEMFSFGPFIPHPQTPLAIPSPLRGEGRGEGGVTLEKVLDTIANARIMYPEAKILVTTALETLWGLEGARQALMAGANSLMINVTPQKYRPLYDIYPNRFGAEMPTKEHIEKVVDLLRSIGRAPTDLSI